MSDLSIDEISNRIIDGILSEPNFNRNALKKIIIPILRIWIKRAQSPQNAKAYENALRSEMTKNLESKLAIKAKYSNKLAKCNNERTFYRNKLIEVIGYDGIEAIDKQMKI